MHPQPRSSPSELSALIKAIRNCYCEDLSKLLAIKVVKRRLIGMALARDDKMRIPPELWVVVFPCNLIRGSLGTNLFIYSACRIVTQPLSMSAPEYHNNVTRYESSLFCLDAVRRQGPVRKNTDSGTRSVLHCLRGDFRSYREGCRCHNYALSNYYQIRYCW